MTQIGCGVRLGAQAASAFFVPTQLTGCVLWLDASIRTSLFTTYNGSTNVTSGGDLIGRWEDLSGNGNHATVTASADRPTYLPTGLNTLPGVSFDGAGDVLSTPSVTLTNATILMVGSKVSPVTYGGYVKLAATPADAASADGRVLYDGLGAGVAHYLGNPATSVYQELDTAAAESAGVVTHWTYGWGSTRASFFLRRAGVAATVGGSGAGVATAPGANPLHINRGYSGGQGNQRWGEIVVYNRVLTLAEIQQVEAYIKTKRGL